MAMVVEEDEIGPNGTCVNDYSNYNSFLDAHVNGMDHAFLPNVKTCRTIAELGYRGPREGYTEEKYFSIKKRIEKRMKAAQAMSRNVLSLGLKYEEPHLRALQQREEGNRIGKLTSVIYLRTVNSKGQEISGYIDYNHRLSTEDFLPVFKKQARLYPRQSDLSYYNWHSTVHRGNDSPNYEVIINKMQMILRSRLDGKLMFVDPKSVKPGENSCRTVVETDEYRSMIIFDHYNRRSV